MRQNHPSGKTVKPSLPCPDLSDYLSSNNDAWSCDSGDGNPNFVDNLSYEKSIWFQTIETHLEHCESCRCLVDSLVAVPNRTVTDWLPDPIPGYEYLRVLGRGGHSLVVLALEKATDREVALKLVPNRNQDQANPWSGGSELSVAAKMEHPNLVRLYGVQQTREWIALVFEYISGGTLQQLDGLLELRDVAALVSKIAAGVSRIHELGFLHLDLKPSNILLDQYMGPRPSDWMPKISDFGIARTARQDFDPSRKGENESELLGTLEYMAPEQFLNAVEQLSVRTDVYGLGRVMQFLLEPLRQNVRSGLETSSLDALQKIAQTCTQDDPQHRYASIAEVVLALDRWSVQYDIGPNPNAMSAIRRERIGYVNSGWRVALPIFVSLGLAFFLIRWMKSSDAPQSVDSASLSVSRWIRDLDTAPAAVTPELEQRLRFLSAKMTRELLGAEKTDHHRESLVRFALLQRAFGERVLSSQYDRYFDLGKIHLENAKALFQQLLVWEPNSDSTHTDLIHTQFLIATIPSTNRLSDENERFNFFRVSLQSLEDASSSVEKLHQPLHRTYWKCRILDVIRDLRRYAKWSGQVRVAELASQTEQICVERFGSDANVADINVRRRLSAFDSSNQVFSPFDKADEYWMIEEDQGYLTREYLVGVMGTFIFGDGIHDATGGSFDWDTRLTDLFERAEDCGIDVDQLPKVLQVELVRPVASISTTFRMQGRLELAEAIQQRHQGLCEAFFRRFPNHPDVFLALSESNLQAWKNSLRRERDADAIQALHRSYDCAFAALRESPSNQLAKDQVADRIKRIARLQAENGSMVPGANLAVPATDG